MSLRTSLLKVADKVRSLSSLPSWDIRTTSLTIRVRTWTGGRIGTDIGYNDEDLVVAPKPRVRVVSEREISGSGGRYQAGDAKVGPFTPAYLGGGYSAAQLAPVATENGFEVLYVLTGEDGGGVNGEYKRVDLETDRALSYWLILRRKRSTP